MSDPVLLPGRPLHAAFDEGDEHAETARVQLLEAIATLETPPGLPWSLLPAKWSVRRTSTRKSKGTVFRTMHGEAVHEIIGHPDPNGHQTMFLLVPSPTGRIVEMISSISFDETRAAAYAPDHRRPRAAAAAFARANLSALEAAMAGTDLKPLLPGLVALHPKASIPTTGALRLASPFMRPMSTCSCGSPEERVAIAEDASVPLSTLVEVGLSRGGEVSIRLMHLDAHDDGDVVAMMRALARLADVPAVGR